MKTLQNQEKFLKLREQFPFMVYQSYQFSTDADAVSVKFHFNLANKYHFQPSLTIPARSFYHWQSVSPMLLENMIFHIGMVEAVSYWKAACPPLFIVEAGILSSDQISWWKNIYFNGLGEFFYLNNIQTTMNEFMEIQVQSQKIFEKQPAPVSDKVLVPVGGGKDSVVSLELLRHEKKVIPVIMNPRDASSACAALAGFSTQQTAIVYRQLDNQLLELNQAGFLNGHTPFSALLAFTSLLVSAASGARSIALSNESSANEATVPGMQVNHQYSKSIDFERDFRQYVNSFITEDIAYFSFLRPINELQITKLFAQYPAYHQAFKSCNVGSKTDTWCCNCPKCLFTWVALSPFVSQQKLTDIFGENLFQKTALLPILESLSGLAAVKPFECVGTTSEVLAALQALPSSAEDHPALLKAFALKTKNFTLAAETLDDFLRAFNEDHYLPESFLHILKKVLHD